MTAEDGIRESVGRWLRAAIDDAERRGLAELKPLLEALAEATVTLRAADWNEGGRRGGGKAGETSDEAGQAEGGGAARGPVGGAR